MLFAFIVFAALIKFSAASSECNLVRNNFDLLNLDDYECPDINIKSKSFHHLLLQHYSSDFLLF